MLSISEKNMASVWSTTYFLNMQAHAIFWEKTQIIFANSYLLGI